MNSITLNCPSCSNIYSQYRQPKVLPCGHSICSICIGQASYYVYCGYCHTKYDENTIAYIPVNLLYFQMLQKINSYLKQKEWESPIKNQSSGVNNQESNNAYIHSVKGKDMKEMEYDNYFAHNNVKIIIRYYNKYE